MSSIEAQIYALAQSLARQDGSPIRVPQTAQLNLHQGLIAAVDTGTNTVHWQHNGSGAITEGVPYIQAYSELRPPNAGDVAWAVQNGPGTFLALGRHALLIGSVTL